MSLPKKTGIDFPCETAVLAIVSDLFTISAP
jgi:hypothetical protein